MGRGRTLGEDSTRGSSGAFLASSPEPHSPDPPFNTPTRKAGWGGHGLPEGWCGLIQPSDAKAAPPLMHRPFPAGLPLPRPALSRCHPCALNFHGHQHPLLRLWLRFWTGSWLAAKEPRQENLVRGGCLGTNPWTHPRNSPSRVAIVRPSQDRPVGGKIPHSRPSRHHHCTHPHARALPIPPDLWTSAPFGM